MSCPRCGAGRVFRAGDVASSGGEDPVLDPRETLSGLPECNHCGAIRYDLVEAYRRAGRLRAERAEAHPANYRHADDAMEAEPAPKPQTPAEQDADRERRIRRMVDECRAIEEAGGGLYLRFTLGD